jgi:hypothetical protein
VSPTIPDFYDGIHWKLTPENETPTFPRAPKTMVIVDSAIICIDETGASAIDLAYTENRVSSETAPPGLTFAEVAGGEVFELADGSQYVVGATRLSGDPTAKVLRFDTAGNMKAISLTTPRLGAAAGIVAGNLVVWGGSAQGAGGEVLNKAEDAFAALPYPSDDTVGSGLAVFDGTTAVVAGGKNPRLEVAPIRLFDTTCSADCATSEIAAMATVLQRTHVYPVAARNLLVTGDSEDGLFHAFNIRLDDNGAEVLERPLREPRRKATSIVLPTGQPAVLGGENPDDGTPTKSIETFFY